MWFDMNNEWNMNMYSIPRSISFNTRSMYEQIEYKNDHSYTAQNVQAPCAVLGYEMTMPNLLVTCTRICM